MKTEIRGEGRPILYLHPTGGARWTPFLEALSKTHAVHMPTFPGFDGSAVDPSSGTGRALAQALAETIKTPIDVIGCSFGGAVALWLALERPDLVDHLVLQGPAGLQSVDLVEDLARIKATTLILHGTEDRVVLKESMQLLKSRLPRAFLVYVWDAAHNIEADQPERMLRLVQSFLERSDAFMVNSAA